MAREINPGRMGDWKDLCLAKVGDKGMDFPWSALSNGVTMVVLPKSLAAKIPFVDHINNKEWVCLVDGRLFLHEHDDKHRLYTLPRFIPFEPKENPYRFNFGIDYWGKKK